MLIEYVFAPEGASIHERLLFTGIDLFLVTFCSAIGTHSSALFFVTGSLSAFSTTY